MQIKILAEGGAMKPGPALSQKLGPIGININKVIEKVNEATKDMAGLKVPVELDIDPATKDFEIRVSSPPVSELLKKELGIEKGSATQKKTQVANASIEQIISVAKTKLPNLLCKDLKAAVKIVVGSCVSLGILVESKFAVEAMQEIESGKYDKEIQEEKTETPEEKKTELDNYFREIKDKQEQLIKEEEKTKEAEAEAKAEKEKEKGEEEKKEEETKEAKPKEAKKK